MTRRTFERPCPEFFLELALYFFLELSIVLGAPVVLCMTVPDRLKIIFSLQNGKNRLSLGFFECIGKLIHLFFSILSVLKVYINCSMLGQTHIWENSGF